MRRRDFLKLAGAVSVAGCATAMPSKGRVVVVGGGFGGATAARYIRMWDPAIQVTLVEREPAFVSCPMSNLVLAGFNGMPEISRSYEHLQRQGVRVLRDEVTAVDTAKKTLLLTSGPPLAYDRLVLSPGVDFEFAEIEGYEAAMASSAVLHGWKAGPQTQALHRQLEQMPDGGTYLLSIPQVPYRCPPGPYERTCLVAAYFKQAKPRSKVLVLDANPDIASKAGLFKRAWEDLYKGLIEYRPNSKVVAVDTAGKAVRTDFETIKGDVLNVVPPQRAADIAVKSGVITTNNRWCDVDWRTMESKAAKGVHVLGDATLSAPAMPKSASMASTHGKIAAAAIVELLNGRTPEPVKVINTCYSFVAPKEAIHVSSVHEWDAGQGTLVAVKGSGGVSAARSEAEATYAWSWARSIWADSLG